MHFEADLDAIQKQQDSINISSDLKQAGIPSRSDFNEIEEHISSQYTKPEEIITIENISFVKQVYQRTLSIKYKGVR